jgi:hypothetical protein
MYGVASHSDHARRSERHRVADSNPARYPSRAEDKDRSKADTVAFCVPTAQWKP